MEVKEIIISYKRRDVFRLYPLGDIHIGTKHCAEDKVKEKIKEIGGNPLAWWIGMGDYAEFISPKDKRWDSKVISEWVDQDNIAEDQTKRIVDLFTPIAGKCIGLLAGNHENSIRRYNHDNVQKNICERLSVTNLGYSAWIKFIFRRSGGEGHVIKSVFSHGAGCAITKGAKINRLERFMDAFNARIYAIGHMHDIIVDSNRAYLDLDTNNKIRQMTKVGAVTGCWFRTYTQGVQASYGEERNYPPTALGCPVFTIIPSEGIVKVEG